MSRKRLRRFGAMVPPGNNRQLSQGMPTGGFITPEPIETSQPIMINPAQPILTNPVEPPPFDRKLPRPWQDRQRGLGFAMRPFNINDIPPGDVAAGLSQYRRGQFFSQLTNTDTGLDATDLVWNRAIGMATGRSADTRPRYFHVGFFGNGVIREVLAPVGPLTEGEIQSASGRSPSLALVRGRVLVQDESGGRYFDVDILGTRNFSIYAFAVTVFILLPETPDGEQIGFEVDSVNPDQDLLLGPGVIEDSFASARVIPVFQNVSQNSDNITRTVTVPAGGNGVIEIPPGSTHVQLRTSFSSTVIPTDYVIAFSVAPTLTAPNALGRIFVIPATTETALIEVPNAKFIVFADGTPNLERTWIATFSVEA